MSRLIELYTIFFFRVQKELLHQGHVYRQRHAITKIPKFKYGIYSIKIQKIRGKKVDIEVTTDPDDDDDEDDYDHNLLSLDNDTTEVLNTSSKVNYIYIVNYHCLSKNIFRIVKFFM